MKTITVKNDEELEKISNSLKKFTGLLVIEESDYGWNKIYYKEGKTHKEDGPAIIWEDGLKEWWREGKTHRIDGPAIESSNGNQYWFIDGEIYSFDTLNSLSQKANVFLDKEKGKYDLEWLKFFTENGIKEFPVIPGMEEDKDLSPCLKRILGKENSLFHKQDK